jgi:hypothetical protein
MKSGDPPPFRSYTETFAGGWGGWAIGVEERSAPV